MVTQNNHGQILIEACLVMTLLVLIGFAALQRLSDLQNSPKKFQLTEEGRHAQKNKYLFKK